MENFKKKAAKYYVAVRPQTNELHTVHREGCPFMPDDNRRILLGEYGSGEEAVLAGQRYFKASNKCQFCAKDPAAHNSDSMHSGHDRSCYMPTEGQISLSDYGGLNYLLN